ncbi:NAD-dependent dehydratase [Actinomycetospora sp. NBRC 106375]|uniref:NAD-dependent epimerase/dehydratase family protein n=1 Tax=Actinomycetospora sp. NBRC 106375 TaxID=3032207 RepID=UPI0024A1B5AF|nr:NAD(P)-dependent oxidoreductase [Actinomycetospora sp. NBRC 106375]GLZ44534.1 NAD-dependent dehydratase [Actinomycetospora sp. NBRC 106375]
MTERVLVTGAAGRIGGYLRTRLARPGRTLRLLDVVTPPDGPGDEVVTASVTDLDALIAACADVDAVVHLGGQSGEADWQTILETNIHGTYAVFEASRRAGVGRVVFASSNHAVGFHPATDPVGDGLPPRPDTYYGVSKVTGEALGSLYHDRYGLDVVCLRIGTCHDRPTDARGLATWLSPDDCGRLVEASLTCPSPGFRIVWGVSANTRRRWALTGAHEIGYRPRDDAEAYAAEVADRTSPDTDGWVGGGFCGPSFDAPSD